MTLVGDPMQTYLYDLIMLDNEVVNILMSAGSGPISEQSKSELIDKFTPVLDRMKPVHEYVSRTPEFDLLLDCAHAYAELKLHMTALMAHNSCLVEQI
jgi:hypothetical protein